MSEEPARSPDPETARIRRIYDDLAPRYDRSAGDGGRAMGDGRAWLARQAQGDTLEVGVGTGRTLRFYPAGVRLTGIELSQAMLAIARDRAARERPDADLRQGDATALPFEDGSFDTVVFCIVLCTIPDHRAAFAEAIRVLRPGGRIAAFEHTRSPRRLVRWAERIGDPITVRRDGDHLLRDPLDLVEEHGLVVEHLERRFLGVMERLVARKPRGA